MSERLPSLVLSGSAGPKVSYEVTFDISTPVDEPVYEQLDWLIGVFAEAGGHGGFAVPSVSPSQSRLSLVSSSPSPPDSFLCKLGTNFVDQRAFQLLRNMAGRLKRQNINVRRIAVIELGSKAHQLVEAPEPSEENENDVYPEISSSVRLEVEGEESEFSKARRCLVEMRNPIEASHVLGIADWIKPWYLILEAGAFAMPIGLPDETDSISGSVTIFDEITVEISVDRFQASECAWNVLVNLLDAYSCISSPVSKVTVD